MASELLNLARSAARTLELRVYGQVVPRELGDDALGRVQRGKDAQRRVRQDGLEIVRENVDGFEHGADGDLTRARVLVLPRRAVVEELVGRVDREPQALERLLQSEARVVLFTARHKLVQVED
jgi:hypothetical protein